MSLLLFLRLCDLKDFFFRIFDDRKVTSCPFSVECHPDPNMDLSFLFTEKREEDDFEEKKAIKKKIKELKFLDSKIAQNLCKYQILVLLS